MSRTRRWSLLGLVGLPLLAAVGCRSSEPVPSSPNTREPPIAVRQRAADSVIQTSATEPAVPCTH